MSGPPAAAPFPEECLSSPRLSGQAGMAPRPCTNAVIGFTVQAHATDRLLVTRRARYQLYGTVIIYEPALKRHQLYPVDPSTTDAIRRSMGVPSLAQLLVEVDELNDSEITRRLRGEIEDVDLESSNEKTMHPVDEVTRRNDD